MSVEVDVVLKLIGPVRPGVDMLTGFANLGTDASGGTATVRFSVTGYQAFRVIAASGAFLAGSAAPSLSVDAQGSGADSNRAISGGSIPGIAAGPGAPSVNSLPMAMAPVKVFDSTDADIEVRSQNIQAATTFQVVVAVLAANDISLLW